MGLAAIGFVCVLVTTSCSSEPGRLNPSNLSSSAAALKFESDADALAAARKTYQSYLAASQQVAEDGGSGIERIAPYVSRSEYAAEVASAQYLKKHGLRSIGATKLIKFSLQTANQSAGTVHAYACVDLKDVRVLTRAGKDVTPSNRPARQTSVPEFRYENGRFVLAKDESWSGRSIC